MSNSYCKTSDESLDRFVGIRFNKSTPEVYFPHGYEISNDERECRRDIFCLLAVMKRFTEQRQGDKAVSSSKINNIPISSYQYIIQDFLNHGYYIEKEIKYLKSVKGKINWKRTIQQEQPQFDNGNVVYLDFQIKSNKIKDDNLLTKIHQYCVYQSFYKFGWLYLSSSYLPQKPTIKYNQRLFISVLKNALNNTFNDDKRKLFQSMIDVILDSDDEFDLSNISIGTKEFYTVWENLIDYIFGESEKEKYFPHGKWTIISDLKTTESSHLTPDTIMKCNGKVYILDAKYYKYGITKNIDDLPKTDSIQKQITYGAHAVNLGVKDKNDVYNAFIMPYNGQGNEKYKFISVATTDWIEYSNKTPNYNYVLGILVDTKYIINEYVRHNDSEILNLANLIEESLERYKNSTITKK